VTQPLALVTGSWRRLGAHIAARLAREGYDIALHAGHSVEPEAWLIKELAGVEHRLFVADLADSHAVAGLVPAVEGHFERPVTLLVNNASRFAASECESSAPFDDLLEHLSVNTAAPLALAKAIRDGLVVNILDQRIVHPPRDQIAYTISKQALAEMTRTLAVALAPKVRVNGVAPGLTIPTDDYSSQQLERLAVAMPLGRLPEPQEIADAVAYLAKAKSVTGVTIFVDGGAHLHAFDRDFVHL
jgi:NAD(P)-dependent dehydrogenase (short-subunit alcohol dehydrogenase family)